MLLTFLAGLLQIGGVVALVLAAALGFTGSPVGAGIFVVVAVGCFGVGFALDILDTLKSIHKATNRNSDLIEALLSKVKSPKPNGN